MKKGNFNPPKRKKIKEDIWDISIYTDEEIIHNLLNMSNPTDRELEIKIWSTLQQYKSSPPTAENLRWMNFYEQIYHRLFSFSEEEEEEEEIEDNQVIEETEEEEIEDNQVIEETEEEEKDDNQETEEENLIEGFESTTPQPKKTTNPSTTTSKSKTDKTDKTDNSDSTLLVTNLQYATGNVNPLLKETITRTLTIDSRYRDNKNEPTTSFLLNLTETIKNVVSIKLYSLHIPFTWYTISSNFGSNYFYISGSSPGIDNVNHQYQVLIPAGNYTQPTLATAINTAIQTMAASHTDICFGTTGVQYNPNNSIMTFTVDIQNIFSQEHFVFSFPKTVSPTDPSYNLLRNTTIASFLGFTNLTYSLNTIQSSTFPYSNSTASTVFIYDTTDVSKNQYQNNQIWIYQYQGTVLFDPSNSVVLATYSITIPPGGYSQTSVNTVINNLIQSQPFLDTNISSLTQVIVPPTVTGDNSSNYFNLTLQLNRYKSLNPQNANTVIFLPDDTSMINNVWVDPISCFRFINRYPSFSINPNQSTTPLGPFFPFYSNEIVSEQPTLQTNYVIDGSASILFTCINPYYDISLNNYKLTLVPSNATGYILPDYVSAINNSFQNPINQATNLDSSANNIFNTTVNTTPFIIKADSKPYFDIDMNIPFNQYTYTVDISGSPLNTILNMGKSFGFSTKIFPLVDLSSNTNPYRVDFSFNQRTQYDMSCSTLLKIYPNQTVNAGNKNARAFVIPPNYTNNTNPNSSVQYLDLSQLQRDLQAAFINYTDPDLNFQPLKGVIVYIDTKAKNNSTGNYFNGYIDFRNIQNIMTETQYTMAFYDPNSSWSNYLYLKDNSGSVLHTDVSYVLSQYNVPGQAYSEISGSNVVLNQIIDISSALGNNTFSIIPDSKETDSLQLSTNSYQYTIPYGNYTRDQLITLMNQAFQTYNDTYYTSLSLVTINGSQYSNLMVAVNKVFTSSDYQLVFYDNTNFQKCSLGVTTTGNASWDSTLGWILGFREYTSYDLSNYINIPIAPPYILNNVATVVADTTCSTTLFNYFILTLDDFNQNHTNDGLVTITTSEKSIPLPSYANRSQFVCDPSSGLYTYTGITEPGTNSLTQNQIYSITEIMNNAVNATSLAGNVPISKYSFGPFITDVLAIVPVKTAGVTNGQTIIVDGGTLQTQNRQYFGPINLNRLEIRLYDDRGHVLNLNNSNWSFTLLVDQIYKKSSASS